MSWTDCCLASAWCGVATQLRCLHFIPGSHRWGLIGPTRGNEGTEHAMSEDFMSNTERWPSVPVPLRPGSVSFHHSMTMHKSDANTSGLRRRGYAIHYMRATSVPDGEITTGAKVRGMAVCNSLFCNAQPVRSIDLARWGIHPGQDGHGLSFCAWPLFPRQSVTPINSKASLVYCGILRCAAGPPLPRACSIAL